MPSYTMRLLKCPSCGGPLEPPAGQTSMLCTYCNNTVIIPENLRTPAPGAPANAPSIFSGIDMNAMVGYGAQWSEVVQLAQEVTQQKRVQAQLFQASKLAAVGELAGGQRGQQGEHARRAVELLHEEPAAPDPRRHRLQPGGSVHPR